MAFAKFLMEINQKVNGKFQKQGEHTIYVPLLRDVASFVAGAEIKKNEKGEDEMEDGIPVYTTVQANWVQDAILAYVKADARNKMVPKSANLKEGKKIAETWEELTAEGVRDGAGLKLAREFKEAFAEWVKKQNLAEAAANALIGLVSNKQALALQVQSTKDKVKARLESFANDTDEETLVKLQRPLEAAVSACASVEADAMNF